tara:strand:+ start:169 stop:375 length:207 start_codon:yes stop_codon:yes gene_type:complete
MGGHVLGIKYIVPKMIGIIAMITVDGSPPPIVVYVGLELDHEHGIIIKDVSQILVSLLKTLTLSPHLK